MYSLAVLSILTLLCYQSPDHFSSSKTEAQHPLNSNSHYLSPQILATTFYFLPWWFIGLVLNCSV